MNIEDIRSFCLNKKAVTESMPFGDDTLVFKVGGKMFLLANLDGPLSLNLKANPEEVASRIEHHSEVSPGYHMNKKHWVTVDVERFLDEKLLLSWIEISYELVKAGLDKKAREACDL